MRICWDTLECQINGGLPNKFVGVKIVSDQCENFPKAKPGGEWKEAKSDYTGLQKNFFEVHN